jgi:CRISPR/Cas system-associated exonuclease Cas4 (RecB family)
MARTAIRSLLDKIYPQPKRQEEAINAASIPAVVEEVYEEVQPKETLPIEVAFLGALEATIKNVNNRKNGSSLYYKPSSLKCLRIMYYQKLGIGVGEYLDEVDSDGIGIGESGTDRHERIQEYITKMKENGFNWDFVPVPEFIKEQELTHLKIKENKHQSKFETNLVNEDYGLSFMTDGLLRFNNEYFILEIKTEISSKFYARDRVDENHYEQATAYSLSFGLDDVIFLYENRDTCAKKAFVLHVTEEMKQKLIDLIDKCDSYVKAGVLPPKTDNKRICSYCKYKKFCKVNKNVSKPNEEVIVDD